MGAAHPGGDFYRRLSLSHGMGGKGAVYNLLLYPADPVCVRRVWTDHSMAGRLPERTGNGLAQNNLTAVTENRSALHSGRTRYPSVFPE